MSAAPLKCIRCQCKLIELKREICEEIAPTGEPMFRALMQCPKYKMGGDHDSLLVYV